MLAGGEGDSPQMNMQHGKNESRRIFQQLRGDKAAAMITLDYKYICI